MPSFRESIYILLATKLKSKTVLESKKQKFVCIVIHCHYFYMKNTSADFQMFVNNQKMWQNFTSHICKAAE